MIKQIDNIYLLGTSHVAKQSANEIKETIELIKPEVVGIELDIDRFKKLMSDGKRHQKPSMIETVKEIGVSGYVFAQIAGFVQSQIGKSLNIDPGVDMKTAYLEAKANSIPTALIDLHIKKTLKKFSALGFGKKMKMFSNLFIKSFKKEYRESLQFDVKEGVPDDETIVKMLSIVEKEVPDMYKILIADRNIYMCDRLMKLKEKHEGPILAVVGAGHVEGMLEILKQRLFSATNEFSYSFRVDVE